MSLTPKQEAFANTYVEAGNASEAYRQSYNAENMKPESIWVEACRTLADPNVALKVFELQSIARERTLVTVESITRELEEVRALAVQGGDLAPANTAIMGKAKVNGLLVDKQLQQGDPDNPIQHVHKIERTIVRANSPNPNG
jgi:phage terminase small subunit